MDMNKDAFWTTSQEDLLIEACFVCNDARLETVAKKLRKDPVEVAHHLLRSTDIPEMAGWDDDQCPDQDAEFMGLTLSGVPLAMALRWCSTKSTHDDRPSHADLMSAMNRPDLRPATSLYYSLGMWFTKSSQIQTLEFLATQPFEQVSKAVQQVIERVDALSPEIIAQQIFGALASEKAICWAAFGSRMDCKNTTTGRSMFTKRKYTSKKYTPRTKKTYGSKTRSARA